MTLVVLATVVAAAPESATADPPPNIILFLADDMEWNSLPFYGPPVAWRVPHTPIAGPDEPLPGNQRQAMEARDRRPDVNRLAARMLAVSERTDASGQSMNCDDPVTEDEVEVCLGPSRIGGSTDTANLAVPVDVNWNKASAQPAETSADDSFVDGFRYRTAGPPCSASSVDYGTQFGGACDPAHDILDGFGGLRRIAEEGVTFKRFYAHAGLCAPTRGVIVTGRYTGRIGMSLNGGAGLPLEEVTIPEFLKQGCNDETQEPLCLDLATGNYTAPCTCYIDQDSTGNDPNASGNACRDLPCYATGLVGKWHVGHVGRNGPLEQGFDEFFGFGGGARNYESQRALICGAPGRFCWDLDDDDPPGPNEPVSTADLTPCEEVTDCGCGTEANCRIANVVCEDFGAYVGAAVTAAGGFPPLACPPGDDDSDKISDAGENPDCCEATSHRKGRWDFKDKEQTPGVADFTKDSDTNERWNCNDDEEVTGTGCVYSERLFRDQARNFIRRHAGRPFFLEVAFHAVHDRYLAPKRTVSHYQTVEQTNVRGSSLTPEEPEKKYWGIVEELDAAVGEIIKVLDEEGIRNNTMILFTGDQGAESAAYGDPDLRGDKDDMEEGGIREGLLVDLPGETCDPADTQSATACNLAATTFGGLEDPEVSDDRIASHVDIFPTIAEAAGYQVDGEGHLTEENTPWDPVNSRRVTIDGRSFYSLLRQHAPEAAAPRDVVYSKHKGQGQVIVTRKGLFPGQLPACAGSGSDPAECWAGGTCAAVTDTAPAGSVASYDDPLPGKIRATSCFVCDPDAASNPCGGKICRTTDKRCVVEGSAEWTACVVGSGCHREVYDTLSHCRDDKGCPGNEKCKSLSVQCDVCMPSAWKLHGDFENIDPPVDPSTVDLYDIASNVQEDDAMDCAWFTGQNETDEHHGLSKVMNELAGKLDEWEVCTARDRCATATQYGTGGCCATPF
ncbi:MAG: sulfatase-like hydrolase/transferase [Deltaproteobacteria bacterium]|nr:sulfatase-like hydrolase/transferase [Deltaproteobacteria bacterium]